MKKNPDIMQPFHEVMDTIKKENFDFTDNSEKNRFIFELSEIFDQKNLNNLFN
jgi:hypothetical protein